MEEKLVLTNEIAEELRAKRKKQLKKDTASKIKSLVDEGKYEQEYEESEEFQHELKLKVRELLTDQEWRRRKMRMRISEEEGRLKKDEEETKETWKRKREHEEQWEGTREQRLERLHEDREEGQERRNSTPKAQDRGPQQILRSKACKAWLIGRVLMARAIRQSAKISYTQQGFRCRLKFMLIHVCREPYYCVGYEA